MRYLRGFSKFTPRCVRPSGGSKLFSEIRESSAVELSSGTRVLRAEVA